MKKQVIVALVICAGLGTFYFMSKEKVVRVGIIELDLPKISPEAATQVVYSGKENYIIGKKEGQFVIKKSDAADAKEFKASKESVRELFDAIDGVAGGIFVTEQTRKHGDFKVTEESGQRVTVMVGDKAVWDLIVGDYAAEGGRYVRIPTENAVFLSKARFWDITRNNMNDFREHQILQMGLGDLKEVRLLRKGELQFGLVKSPENAWVLDRETLSKNTKTNLSTKKVDEYVNLLVDLRATSFVDDAENLKKAKKILEQSGNTVMLFNKDGGQTSLILARDEGEKKSYVKRDGDSEVFEITDYLSSKILAQVDDFELKPGV